MTLMLHDGANYQQNSNWIDPHLYFMLAIDCIKMRRWVVIKIHPNDDTEKAAYFRHGILLIGNCVWLVGPNGHEISGSPRGERKSKTSDSSTGRSREAEAASLSCYAERSGA